MKTFFCSLACLSLSGLAYAGTVFMPIVSAPARPVPSANFPYQNAYWISTQTVSNLTDSSLTFRYKAIFGGDYAYISDGCSNTSLVAPANTSWEISSLGGSGCVYPGTGGVGFVQMDLDRGLMSSGGIHLAVARSCIPNQPAPAIVSLTSAPLPVYEAFFSAASTAASVDISAMRPAPFDDPCRDMNDPLMRRVNVTLLNGGLEAATATVSVVGKSATPYAVVLKAGEVLQINDVFLGLSYQVLAVSASQPFLCYASSVTTFTDPTRAPAIEVYPFRQIP
jgi:hypothetical protein